MEDIIDAICTYSSAYKKFEKLQKESELFQIGDQKTGVIGELYSLIYAKSIYGEKNVSLAPSGAKTYDIEVKSTNVNKIIQVKTVSHYSNTRRVSPIKHNEEEFAKYSEDKKEYEVYILSLNECFYPNGLWIFRGLEAINLGKLVAFNLPAHDKILKQNHRFFNKSHDFELFLSSLEEKGLKKSLFK
jgi:hypothetical protein